MSMCQEQKSKRKGLETWKSLTRMGLFVSLFFLSLDANAGNTINQKISIQGILKATNGATLNDGTYRLKFDIQRSTGGTPLWSKTFSGVPVQGGFFSVTLGGADDSSVLLTPSLLSLPDSPPGLYNQVNVHADLTNDLTYAESFLAIPLTSVPSSFIADQANVALSVADGSVTTNSLTDGSVTGAKISNGSLSFDKLSQGGASMGQLIQWDGSAWVPTSNTVTSVGGVSAASIASAVSSVNAATHTNTVSTIVQRNSSGNFTAGTISAALVGNIVGNVTGNLTGNVTGNLVGNVTGTASNNILRSGDTMTGPLLLSGGPSVAMGAVTKEYQDNALALKENVLGFTPVNKAGDTGLGNLSLASGKTLGLGGFTNSTEISFLPSLGASDSGRIWYNTTSNQIKYWDGTASQAVGVLGNYITGLTGDVTATGPVNGGVATATVAAVGGVTAANIVSGANLSNGATDTNTASTLVRRNATGSFSAGTVTANLVGNVTGIASENVLRTGDTMTGLLILSGDPVTSLGASTKQYVDGKFLSGVTSFNTRTGQVTLSSNDVTTALTYTPVNKAGDSLSGYLSLNGDPISSFHAATKSYVDGSLQNKQDVGDYITALTGDVTATGPLNGGGAAATVAQVGGVPAAQVASGVNLAISATNANMANTLVKRDATGNFSAGTITGTLIGSASFATTAGSATNFSGSLSGDVTGTQSATTVAQVGGLSAATIVSGINSATSATEANTASTLVRRDSAGNFSAGTITADLLGNASFATLAGSVSNFTGSLSGDVTGTQSATTVVQVGGIPAATVATATGAANAATNTNTAGSLVRRDVLGNFSAGTITADLLGNASFATFGGSASNFTGSLSGDVTGTQSATTVAQVGGLTAAVVATGVNTVNAATSANSASSIVRRDPSGSFSAGTITADLNGNATSATTAGSATNFTGSLVGDVTGTQSATVVSLVGGVSAANVASGANLANAGTNTNIVSTLVRRDSAGNFSAGTITAALIGNATSATTAGSASNFTGTLSGDVTGPQSATVVSLVGGVSAANVALGANSANAATNTNTASTIVRRDSFGNLSAGTITADLLGHATTATSASNFSGSLSGDVTGTQVATIVAQVAGLTASTVASGASAANAATNTNTVSTIVRRDSLGNFSAGTLTATLLGNASTATTAGSSSNFSGSLAGDVTGTQSATVVSLVGGVSAANVASGANLANAGTNTNTVSTLVRRDALGNFSAGTVTATLLGNATTATTAGSASSFTGSLVGNVTGTQSATVVSMVGGVSAANVASGANAANAATNTNIVSTLVKRDELGNFSAGTITADLIGNATSATTANGFSGSLVGDVTGTQSATVVAQVGGATAANVASGANIANAATHANTLSTVVRRDSNGNFSAGTITATLLGNASSATAAGSATNFTGSLVGDVTGTQSATVISTVGGVSAANVASGANTANAATNANTVSTIVKRDSNGNFSAGTITGTLNGSASSATIAGSATNFTGALVGDVTGTQSATVVSMVGGVTAANIASGATLANASTATNAANTLVKRDSLGNFSAGTITANLLGSATSATIAGSATSFTGSLLGDVTGTQSATVVSTVGGVTAANVASGANLANAGTSANTVSTIVRRDASGNFSAGTITAVLAGNATSATTAGSATNFTGSLVGDVTGTQSATVVSTVGGVSAANVASGANLANAGTNANTVSTIVRRDASGSFSAGTITATLNGNATSATSAGSATNFTGPLVGDVTGTQSATVVSTVGGVSAANVASGTNLANAATQSNTASAVVRRDSLGNFSAGTITGQLVGVASGNTTYTPNNHGLVISGATNQMSVIPPNASTTYPLVSGGTSADPTWSLLSIAGGGTGSTTAAGAFNALSPMTTLGDIITGGASGAGTRLAGNTSSTRQFLLSEGSGGLATAPSWTALQASDVPALPYVSSVGLSLPSIFSVSGSPVASSGTLTASLATQSANVVFAGPTSGGAAAPTFRSLVGADLPLPTASTLGGVQSFAAQSNKWIQAVSTSGVPTATQPTFSDISGTLSVSQGGTGAVTLTSNGMLYGNGTGAIQATSAGSQYQVFQAGASGVPTVGAVNLAQASAVIGVLPNTNTTGTSSNTANTLVARDALGNFTAGTVTAALVGNVIGTASNNILKAGDTMSGALVLPANGLTVGTTQLVASGNNIGINTGSPAASLHVVAGSAATSGEILEGASGQTANLLEFRNDSGTVLSHVDSTGMFFALPGIVIGDTTSTAAVAIQKESTEIVSVSGWTSIAIRRQGTRTVTFTGAAVGDLVTCTPASGSPLLEAGLVHTCFVSAANTVTLTLNNLSAASITPATRNWRITWLKQ